MGRGIEVPPVAGEGTPDLLSRRELLQRTAIAVAGLAVAPVALSACAAAAKTDVPQPAPGTSGPPSTSPGTPPSVSPSASASVPRSLRIGTGGGAFAAGVGPGALAALSDANVAFAAQQGEVTFSLDSRDVSEGAEYFAGTPPDVVSYSESVLMRRFGRQGAVIPLDDVWTDVKGNYASTVAEVLTAADGHIYGLPFQFHSTVFFYRKSVFAAKGYQPPATWSDLLALCARMKSDGLAPLALGNRDLWPQLFVFDMLDLRLNGYAFHKGLLTGRERWTDPRLLKVFEAWRKLIPYYPPDYADTTWQDAAAALVQKHAGMYFIGSFAVGQFETLDESIVDDLDCFEFPYFGNEWDGEHALLAGMDVWVIPAKASGGQASRPTATAYLEHWAKGSTQLLLHRQIHSYLPLARDVDPAQLAAPSRRIFELMGKAGHLFEGLDRAVTAGFPPEFWYYLREFAAEPGTDLTEFLRSIQQRWDDIGPDEVEPPLS